MPERSEPTGDELPETPVPAAATPPGPAETAPLQGAGTSDRSAATAPADPAPPAAEEPAGEEQAPPDAPVVPQAPVIAAPAAPAAGPAPGTRKRVLERPKPWVGSARVPTPDDLKRLREQDPGGVAGTLAAPTPARPSSPAPRPTAPGGTPPRPSTDRPADRPEPVRASREDQDDLDWQTMVPVRRRATGSPVVRGGAARRRPVGRTATAWQLPARLRADGQVGGPGGGRRGRWLLLTLVLQSLLCAGGLVALGEPVSDQYPASVEVNSQVPGLVRVADEPRQRTAERLLTRLRSGRLDEQAFVALYAEAANRQRQVTLFGTTRLIAAPSRDLDATMFELVGDLRLADVRAFEAGSLGGEQRCGAGQLDGVAIIACGWADRGSIAIGLFTGRTEADGAAALHTVRASVLRRG